MVDFARLQSIWFETAKWPEKDILKWWKFVGLPNPIAIGPANANWDAYAVRDPALFNKDRGFVGQKMGDGSMIMFFGSPIVGAAI